MARTDDPLGLWTGVANQQPAPAQPTKKTGIKDAIWAIALVAILAIGWQYRGTFSGGGDGDDPRPGPVVVEGSTLVFLHERNPQPIEHDELLRELPAWCADRKMQFRAFDDDISDEPIPKLITWALTKGVSPPMVILTDRENRPVKVASWPDSLEALEDFVK